MFLFNYVYLSPTLNLKSQSLAIRASYLIADEAYICGDLDYSVFIDKNFYTTNPQFAAEIMLLEEKDPEAQKALKETISTLKQFKTMKHKTGKLIVFQKQVEKMVMNAWQEFRTRLVAASKSTGLSELSKIPESDSLGVLCSSSTNAEEDSKNAIPCSRILLLEMQDDNVPTAQNYFMLPYEYTAMYRADTTTGFDFTNWNESNLSFFNINILTATELMLVRTQLRPVAKPFCEAIDKWSAMLPTFTIYAQSYGWYQQFVKPAAAALQQAIDANEILSAIPRLSGNNVITTVHIGEAPTEALWLFFDMHQNIADETKKVLQKPEAKAFAAKRKPYFSMNFIDEAKSEIQQPNGNEEIVPVKKFISFD